MLELEILGFKSDRNALVCNGRYDNEKTAAQASDNLARKLMKNGERAHKLNFPADSTEVYPFHTTFGIMFWHALYGIPLFCICWEKIR